MILERLRNWSYESYYNISTFGKDYSKKTNYSTLPYSTIWKVLDRLKMNADDVFVDVGCGKGRVLCCAARTSAYKIIGIDLSRELCDQAKANAWRQQHKAAPVEVYHCDAANYNYYDATVLFFFCPVSPEVFNEILIRIERTSIGSLRLAFVNTNDHYEKVFLMHHPWLKKYDEFSDGHRTTFYKKIAQGRNPAPV